MAETLSTLSIISFVTAGVAFALAVLLWIFLKIPRVIGDLSGRTARKSIARVRARNEKSEGKSYRPSKMNVLRGKLTSAMQFNSEKKLNEKRQSDGNEMPETRLLAENRAKNRYEDETELLIDKESTAMLTGRKSAVPSTSINPITEHRTGGRKLNILEEIILVHTDEVME